MKYIIELTLKQIELIQSEIEHCENPDITEINKILNESESKSAGTIDCGAKIAEETLRDKFAMYALGGLISNATYFNPEKKDKMIIESLIFERAYSMADGMIKQRNKSK